MSDKFNKVGELYTTHGNDVWRVITYCDYPTATLENLETKETIGGATCSLNLSKFVRLTAEESPGEQR